MHLLEQNGTSGSSLPFSPVSSSFRITSPMGIFLPHFPHSSVMSLIIFPFKKFDEAALEEPPRLQHPYFDPRSMLARAIFARHASHIWLRYITLLGRSYFARQRGHSSSHLCPQPPMP